MKQTIYKFPLQITDRQAIKMPRGAKILDAQFQTTSAFGDSLEVWALVHACADIVVREIAIYGTGNPVPEHAGEHIATVQQPGSSLVWHIFDRGVVPA